MITQTSDNLAPIKVEFSIKDPIHQGPERSTPKWITSPGGLAPLKRQSKVTLTYTV
jgi:hypothetical protein